MFWLMFVAGFVLSSIFEMPSISLVNLFVTPYIISKRQKVSLNKEGIFVNSEGKLLNDRYPVYAFWMFILSIACVFIMGLSLDALKVEIDNDAVETVLLFGIPMLPFVLYFMYVNCPISIFFKLTSWHPALSPIVLGFEWSSGSIDHNRRNNSSLKAFMNENPITDPRWSGSSSNIFNRR